MPQKMRAHLFIEGMVQGVCFRAYTQDEARKRGVTGWVRNLSDGRVEALLEGEEAAVRSMIEWCHSGPPHAVVTAVSCEVGEYRGECRDFTVRF